MARDAQQPHGDPDYLTAVQRVEGSFRDAYLTLVSIIQGVALGFLVQVVGADYRSIGIDKAGRDTAIFLVIVAVWQEYAVGSTMYAWIPTSVDTLVPFLLGAGEGMMIAAVDGTISEFLFLTTLTWIAGFAVALNYAVHAALARLDTTRQSQRILAGTSAVATHPGRPRFDQSDRYAGVLRVGTTAAPACRLLVVAGTLAGRVDGELPLAVDPTHVPRMSRSAHRGRPTGGRGGYGHRR
jgi:hypothetical protein